MEGIKELKEVFSYSGTLAKFTIFEHGIYFHLRKTGNNRDVLRCDNIQIAKAYIDGYTKFIDELPLEVYRILKSKNV